MRTIESAGVTAKDLRIGIVVTRWNALITDRLLDGALECIRAFGGTTDAVTVVRCPGAFEMPIVLKAMADSGRYDALVALGAVIRGETPHFDYVAGEAAAGIVRASMDAGVPCGFGLLTLESLEQGLSRAGAKHGNKGWEAAQASIETAGLLAQIVAA